MIAAVELRTDPTQQCNFQPLLKPNTPGLCADQKNPPVIYKENFKDGLAGWTLTNQGVFAGWPGLNWAARLVAAGRPRGHGGVRRRPDDGNCDGGAGDISGVMRLDEPVHPAARTRRS